MSVTLTPEELAARKRRNVWIAMGLVAFMVLVFATTFLRMQRNFDTQRAIDAAAASDVQPAGRVIVPAREVPAGANP